MSREGATGNRSSQRLPAPGDVIEASFLRFAHRLIALARTQLGATIRQKVDPEDVVQSVYRSFCRRQANAEFELVTWDEVWGLLARSTVWKCKDRVKHFRAASRDVRRESSLRESVDTDTAGPPWEGVSRDPAPEEAAVLADTLRQLMSKLDEDGRSILTLRLQGYTVPEIAAQVHRGERTVERVLARVRKWLKDTIEGD